MTRLWLLLFGIFFILNGFDFYSTKLVLEAGGIEANPIVNWVIVNVGMNAVVPFKLLYIWVLWAFRRFITTTVLATVDVIFLLIVVNNFIHYVLLTYK